MTSRRSKKGQEGDEELQTTMKTKKKTQEEDQEESGLLDDCEAVNITFSQCGLTRDAGVHTRHHGTMAAATPHRALVKQDRDMELH